jgi:hypothetical protein
MIFRNMSRWCLAVLFSCALVSAESPVLVELFTSEGCSDCPPADILLARLESMQPVPGARVIALSEHVDYWDHQGWRDPFSSPQFTERQQEYSQLLHDHGPYTPQMVVDGAAGFVGSQSKEALYAIGQAARAPKSAMRITTGDGKVAIQVDGVTRAADVLLAVTESNLLSNVARGENAGRKLTHTAVVRSLRVVGKARPGERFTAEVKLAPTRTWKPENLRVVAFLQDRSTRHIVGAAEAALGR